MAKKAGKDTFAALYCAIFRMQSFSKSLKFFRTFIASLDPQTVQLPAAREAKPRFGERSAHDCQTDDHP